MKKHILFVLDYYLPHCGGVETVFEQIINKLHKKGYKITLLTSRFDKGLLFHESKKNLEIYRVGNGRIGFFLTALWEGIYILLKHKDISVIHASTYGGAIPASILGILFNRKVILTVHEVFGKLWIRYKGIIKGWIYLLFERIIFWLPYDVYHCVSRYTMNSLRLLYNIRDDKIQVIYNGLDNDFWSPDKVSVEEIQEWKKTNLWNGRYVVLYYGHAGESKGLDALIECVPQMIKHDPDVLFVFNIIDSKRRKKALLRLEELETFGFARQIQRFNGMSKIDLRIMVAASDLVVAPSYSEGFGSVHTEVVSMQKPFITTYVASIPEVVSGKVAFVRPGSSNEILQTILDIREDKDVREKLPIRKFSWDRTVEYIEQLY